MVARPKSKAREATRVEADPPVCVPKFRVHLPPTEWAPAVKTACDLNPNNDVPELRSRGLTATGVMPEPQFLAIAIGNYWGVDGVDLGVKFLDNPTQACRNKILAAANVWGQRCNVRFRESASGEIRLARARNQGYYSYLGPDILHIPANQQTMNLDSFTENTPDSEYLRVVPHEFGHTLGAIHDQLRKTIQDLLDAEKTIAYFMATQGWSRQDVIAQILTPVPESQLKTIGDADPLSIMTYQFPGNCTKSGKPIIGGTRVNDRDFEIMSRYYPKVVTPTVPPPGPPPTSGTFSIPVAVQVMIDALRGAGYTVTK